MKTKNTLLTFLAMVFASSINAQSPSYKWTKTFGGAKSEYINSIIADKNGNVLSTGSFESSIDIDPGASVKTIISNGGSDIFVTKMDAAGKLLWSKNIGGSANDVGYSIAVDTGGNVYVTGSFQDYVDFGVSTPLYSSGSEDVFVVKYDAAGTVLWAKSIGGSYADYGRSISLDTLGGLYVTGKFLGMADFDPSSNYVSLSSSMGSEDVFIVKWDQNGIYQWAKGIGSAGYDVGTAIAVNPSGDVFATGIFSGPVNFNPLSAAVYANSVGLQDVYFAKYDRNGIFQWVKSFGSTDNDYSRGIAIDNKSNVYITGYFSGVAFFDPAGLSKKVSATGGYDAFVCKLDKSGTLAWVNPLGGVYSDFGYAVSVDDKGNVYTTGSFESTADFDPSPAATINLSSNGSSDIFISKLDANGNGLWATNLGGTANDEGSSVFVYKNNDIYTAGDFRNTADFNYEAAIDNFTSNGSTDAYIHKISMSANSISYNSLDVKMELFPNPTDGIVNLRINNVQQDELTLSLFDAGGALIQVQHIKDSQASIDLSGQASGIYFVKLAASDASTSRLISIVRR